MGKPIFSDKGTWGKVNSFFGLAVMAKYSRVGGFSLAILYYIVGEYNKMVYSASIEDYKIPLTFDDLANKGNTHISTIQKAIKLLLKHELIKKANVPKGRTQTLYIPNVKLLNELTNEYLKYNPNDKTRQQYKPM